MYVGGTMSAGARARLLEYEAQERTPIRLVPAGVRHSVPWRDYARYSPGFTLAECEERGVTIASIRGSDWLPEGVTLIEDDRGAVVGGYLPRAIYVIAGSTTPLDNVMPVESMIATLQECTKPELMELAEELAEAHREQALREFMRNTYSQRITEVRGRIDNHTNTINANQTRITQAMRALQQEQEILNVALAARDSDPGDRVLAEYELLKNHARVESVRFDGEQHLTITTTDDVRITRDDTGESRYLGQFAISIDLDSMEVKINNLTNRRGGRDHPHIVDGDPCFGNHGSDFSNLLARAEFYTWFECVLQYLESLNLRDEYGAYGSYWFDVPDERPVAVEAA